MVAPRVSGGVTGSHLVNGPSSLADAVAAGKAEILHNIHHAHAHPHALISRLLLDHNVDARVVFVQNFLDDGYGVSSCTLEAFGLIHHVVDLYAGGFEGFAEQFFLCGVC